MMSYLLDGFFLYLPGDLLLMNLDANVSSGQIKPVQIIAISIIFNDVNNVDSFVAPLAESQSSLCHGELSVVCPCLRACERPCVTFLFQTTSHPLPLCQLGWNFIGSILSMSSPKCVQLIRIHGRFWSASKRKNFKFLLLLKWLADFQMFVLFYWGFTVHLFMIPG